MLIVNSNGGRRLIWRKIFSWMALWLLEVAVTSALEGRLLVVSAADISLSLYIFR